MAAPSPAPLVDGRLLILGGDDGTQVATAPTNHTGFRRDVLAYDPKADQWATVDNLPFANVTTSAVGWQDRIVVPSGEIKPGIRSPEVWSTVVR